MNSLKIFNSIDFKKMQNLFIYEVSYIKVSKNSLFSRKETNPRQSKILTLGSENESQTKKANSKKVKYKQDEL